MTSGEVSVVEQLELADKTTPHSLRVKSRHSEASENTAKIKWDDYKWIELARMTRYIYTFTWVSLTCME